MYNTREKTQFLFSGERKLIFPRHGRASSDYDAQFTEFDSAALVAT